VLLFPGPCPFASAQIAGLKATVVLLMILLMKSKLLRVKMSLLGSFLFLVLLGGAIITSGLLATVAGGSIAYAFFKQQRSE
tara:strand:- start:1159 stop:1401 length:243 start_codon:yes stop_codon:yes gene_type:complete